MRSFEQRWLATICRAILPLHEPRGVASMSTLSTRAESLASMSTLSTRAESLASTSTLSARAELPSLPADIHEQSVARFVREAPSRVRLIVRLAVWVVWLAPFWTATRFALFGTLSPDERVSLLRDLARSPVYLVRELPLLLKLVACLGACGTASMRRALGIRRRPAQTSG